MLRIVIKDNKAIIAVADPAVNIAHPNSYTVQVGDAEELRTHIVENQIDITNIVDDVMPYLETLGLSTEDLAPYITDEEPSWE